MTTGPLPITIRPGRSTDAKIVVRFNRAMALETEGKRLNAATLARGVAVALSSPALCRYYLAEVRGTVAGQVMVTYEWSDWRAGLIWWMQSVYVAPGHRRKGVFRALYRYVEAAARREPGVCGLRLYVERHNRRAMRTYRSLGMGDAGYVVYEKVWER